MLHEPACRAVVSVIVELAASSPKFGGRMLESVSGCATALNVATNSGITLPTVDVIVGAAPETLPDQPRKGAVVSGLTVAVNAVPNAV